MSDDKPTPKEPETSPGKKGLPAPSWVTGFWHLANRDMHPVALAAALLVLAAIGFLAGILTLAGVFARRHL